MLALSLLLPIGLLLVLRGLERYERIIDPREDDGPAGRGRRAEPEPAQTTITAAPSPASLPTHTGLPAFPGLATAEAAREAV